MRAVIVVAGEALIDLVVSGDSITAAPGGAPYNVARAIGRLGAPVALLAGTSVDRFGQQLQHGLDEAGVDGALLQRSARPTTLAVAQLDDRGAATYTFYTEGTSAPAVAPVALPPSTTAFVTGGLALVLRPLADAVARVVEGLDPTVLTVLDVNCRPLAVDDHVAYRERVALVAARANVVKASDEDLDYLALGPSALGSAHSLLDLGAGVVVITRGSAPTTVVTGRGTREVAVPSATVVDTIGAGDTFTAGLVTWWLERGTGAPADADLDALAAAVTAAQAVAAVVVTRRGADPPRRDELGPPWT